MAFNTVGGYQGGVIGSDGASTQQIYPQVLGPAKLDPSGNLTPLPTHTVGFMLLVELRVLTALINEGQSRLDLEQMRADEISSLSPLTGVI
jgi:hypothetical protein